MDETGLIFKDSLSGKSFHEKGKGCNGGKRLKERITVSVCSNVIGEKEQLLVIGMCERPRCFKGIDIASLPVLYRFNKKAWMTSTIFSDWLNRFNRKMKRQGRNVLLFLDNAPTHPKVDLSNVKLKFFPPNTTSHLQPMDQGIIQAMKLKYRKRQLQYLIAQMDRQKRLTGSQLLKHITILGVIYWVSSAWTDVDSSTITKCFSKAGFLQPLPAPSTETLRQHPRCC
ncbi:tigger transposable element-derived protein 4-like [Argopecten irradians]|uniref:tigger transposable element-derived protein 4-like n=1 Tax=Argopecten irradians TaxID=31199 RepID=UPI0037197711